MKQVTQILLTLALTANLLIAAEIKHNYKPKEGYVPDAETAIRIAVAVWVPIYGADNIARQKPYIAILKNGTWYVSGSLPKGAYGGTAIAEIAKDDGRVLRVSHEA